MTELTKILGKSYEKLKKNLRRTYEKVMKTYKNRILIVDKSKHSEMANISPFFDA